MNFQPRQVPPGNMRMWLSEALELSKRRVWAFLALGGSFSCLAYLDNSGMVVPCLFPLSLSIGSVIAMSADQSKPVLEAIRSTAHRAWVRVFLVSSTPWVILAFVSFVMEIVSPGQGRRVDLSDGIIQPSTNMSESLAGVLFWFGVAVLVLGVIIYFMVRMTRFLWFFWTLCVVADAPVVEAFSQSMDGADINPFVIWPYGISIVLLLPVILLPALFIPWLAITTSLLYVSYRDIWLARMSNRPIRVRATDANTATIQG